MTTKNILADMKESLRYELKEWLGSDIPEEGDDDYETWQSRTDEIDAIGTKRYDSGSSGTKEVQRTMLELLN